MGKVKTHDGGGGACGRKRHSSAPVAQPPWPLSRNMRRQDAADEPCAAPTSPPAWAHSLTPAGPHRRAGAVRLRRGEATSSALGWGGGRDWRPLLPLCLLSLHPSFSSIPPFPKTCNDGGEWKAAKIDNQPHYYQHYIIIAKPHSFWINWEKNQSKFVTSWQITFKLQFYYF